MELRRLYTRDLLQHCVDAHRVALQQSDECCISGDAGKVCFFVSTRAGNEMGEQPGKYYPKIDPKTFNGQYYW